MTKSKANYLSLIGKCILVEPCHEEIIIISLDIILQITFIYDEL